jgi:nitroreductase
MTAPFDTAVTDELLVTTRSVRKRLDLARPVEPEVIVDCLRVAVQAPTASNTQTWRWLVVTDASKRAGLAELYRQAGGAYLKAQAESGLVGQQKRVYDSANYLADHLHEVPVHVVPCILGRVDGKGNEGTAAFYGSIIPAAWSFMLALRSRGLGSTWTTPHLMKEQEAAALLGIPDDVTQVALLPWPTRWARTSSPPPGLRWRRSPIGTAGQLPRTETAPRPEDQPPSDSRALMAKASRAASSGSVRHKRNSPRPKSSTSDSMAWRNDPVMSTTMVNSSGAIHAVPWLHTSKRLNQVASRPAGIMLANRLRDRATVPPRAMPMATPATTASVLLSRTA